MLWTKPQPTSETLWNEYKEIFTKVADEVLGEQTAYKGKKKTTLRWTEEVWQVVKIKM